MSNSEKPKSRKEFWQSIKNKNKWLWLFIFIAWIYMRFLYFIRHWSFLDILGLAGRLTVLVAVIFYFRGCEDRQKAKHYQAWQVINLAQGKTGSGGRKDALEDLHKDGISLVGVDISQAYLPQLDLENAYLWKANFSKANLFGATLSHAVLQYANLSCADVSEANLEGVMLTGANLSKAKLSNTNLSEAALFDADVSGANLRGANLSGAKLVRADLSHADLSHAYLSGADASGANFSGVDLSEANLRKSNLRGIKNWRDIKSIKQANIYNVKNPPDGFKEWAKKKGAVEIEDDEGWKKWPHMK